ncbi:MAG: hypothetical protein EOQ57_23870 [Mesorhizobium sp.]|uniref:hypothetical protein n=1 Tax=Mesorhizobium sp. TaxID=1871066 RepID=UPI000FE52945|nr:hypothetical protein [Mesorhizobium sp.]RWB97634.1 MAG: hypothetical protein EOQ57_23870 [Mesorhizobium sp.]
MLGEFILPTCTDRHPYATGAENFWFPVSVSRIFRNSINKFDQSIATVKKGSRANRKSTMPFALHFLT